eukprot:Em0045g20a
MKVETFCSHGYKISCYPALLEAVLDVGQSRWFNCSAKHTLSQVSTTVHDMLLLLYDWHSNLGCHDTSDFQRFGNGNLHVSPGVTLLHFMLSHQVMTKLTKAGITPFSHFASHILTWGGVINQPNPTFIMHTRWQRPWVSPGGRAWCLHLWNMVPIGMLWTTVERVCLSIQPP